MKTDKNGNLKLIIIEFILLVISIFTYRYIFQVQMTRKIYERETVQFIEENQNPIFTISEIILYNSANAVDNSDGELKDIDISQFTDIAIFINNKAKLQEITAENTINQLFINNIKINTEYEDGEKILNYKNPLNMGKYVELENFKDDKILFNVINTNEKNEKANYDENVFYTDCSNPISLSYINKNILTGCQLTGGDGVISFDASILKDTGIDLNKLKTDISFSINIVNNYNEKFICNVNLDNDLVTENNEIYSGYLMKVLHPKGDEFKFIKISD